jgi:hypothetical protein
MTYKLVLDLALLVAVLAFAAVFRRYIVHIYTVGREDAVRCLGIGCGVGFAMALALTIGGAVLPEGRVWWLMGLVLLPMALTGFSAGFLLIAGLAGFDGGRHWVLSILVVGGSAVFAANFIPVGGGFIFAGVSAYGLGAAILALWTPMADEASPAGSGGATEQPLDEPATRTRLSGDLSPLSPRGPQNRDEQ